MAKLAHFDSSYARIRVSYADLKFYRTGTSSFNPRVSDHEKKLPWPLRVSSLTRSWRTYTERQPGGLKPRTRRRDPATTGSNRSAALPSTNQLKAGGLHATFVYQ